MLPDSKTAEIIHSLFPGVGIQSLEEVNIGWNSRILILNGEYTIKLPKTRSGLKGIRKEIRITDAIRGNIPVAIPEYLSTSEGIAKEAFAYRFISGTMLTKKPLGNISNNFDPTSVSDHELYISIQKQLADILTSIHGIQINLVRDIFKEYVGETWAETYEKLGKKFVKDLEKAFHGQKLDDAKASLEKTVFSITASRFPEKFIHGDFGGWNIIYRTDLKKISGVVDWADCRIGDPALDFAELIYDYGEPYAEEVLGFYGHHAGKGFMDRARLYLKLEGFRDLHYGIATDSAEFVEKGRKKIMGLKNEIGS